MLRRPTGDDTQAIAALFRGYCGTLAFLPTLHTPEKDVRYERRP